MVPSLLNQVLNAWYKMRVGHILGLLAIALMVSQSLIISVHPFESTHLHCIQNVDDLIKNITVTIPLQQAKALSLNNATF